MCMDPEPEEPFRQKSCIDLLVEVIGHRFVIEFDRDQRCALPDQPHVCHE